MYAPRCIPAPHPRPAAISSRSKLHQGTPDPPTSSPPNPTTISALPKPDRRAGEGKNDLPPRFTLKNTTQDLRRPASPKFSKFSHQKNRAAHCALSQNRPRPVSRSQKHDPKTGKVLLTAAGGVDPAPTTGKRLGRSTACTRSHARAPRLERPDEASFAALNINGLCSSDEQDRGHPTRGAGWTRGEVDASGRTVVLPLARQVDAVDAAMVRRVDSPLTRLS